MPYFVDYDLAVDSAGLLHIGSTICSGAIANDDSLNYIAQYNMSINPGKKYLWGHRKGLRPYIYDFVGDGTAPWKVLTIDSMSTEDPGSASTASGYNENPWDPTGTGSAKINMDSRLQLGRTPDGKFITYSWTESDTAFTTGAVKFNILPNIKTRCLQARGGVNNYVISPTEINVSKPATGQGTVNPNVSSRATLHYMSPVTSQAAIGVGAACYTIEINTPFTVTNSNPWSQLTNNATWYTSAKLTYGFGCTGIEDLGKSTANAADFSIFPNPANESVHVAFNVNNASKAEVKLFNVVGAVVRSYAVNAEMGSNEVVFDVKGLPTGIYMVNLKAGNTQITKKLIVE